MLRDIRALFAAAVLVVLTFSNTALAANEYDDLCTFATGTTTWSSITTASPAPSCVGTSNSISNTDLFVVPNGATVNITGPIAFANRSDAGILVQSGGTLNCLRSAGCNLITLPPGGNEATDTISERVAFRVLAGGTANVTGGFRQFFSASPSIQPTQSNTEYLTVGETIPCPSYSTTWGYEPDCAGPGNTDEVWWVYPSHKYTSRKGSGTFTAGMPDMELQAGLAQIVGGEDVAYFFDPDPTDSWVSGDYGYAYKIRRIGDATTALGFVAGTPISCQGNTNSPICVIEIDPRQTSVLAENLTGSASLANRSVIEATLSADVQQGSRVFTLPAGTISANNQLEGYWVRFQDDTELCGDADATPCRIHHRPYRIMRSVDGGAGVDTFTLLDTRGVARAFPATCGAGACRVWITQGHLGEEGDPISIRAPVTFRAAAGVTREYAAFLLQGTATLDSYTLDGIGRVTVGNNSALALVFRNGWHIDPASPIFSHFNFTDAGGSIEIDNWSMTGGNATGPDPNNESGFVTETGPNTATYTIGTMTWRHISTSCFNIQKSDTITGRRIMRCQHPSTPTSNPAGAVAITLIDGTGNDPTTDLTINDFEWVGPQSHETGVIRASFGTSTTGDVTIQRGVILGGTSVVAYRDDVGQTNRKIRLRQTLVAGIDHSVTVNNYATFMDVDWDHVTVRESTASAGSVSPINNFNRRVGADIRNSFIQDWSITSTSTGLVLDGPLTIDNLAVYNLRFSTYANAFQPAVTAGRSAVMRRLSFVWPHNSSTTGMNAAMDVNVTSGVTLTGLHIEGFKGTRFTQFSEAEMQGMTRSNWCFFDPGTASVNAYTNGANPQDDLPVTTYIDRSAGMWDRDGYQPLIRDGSIGDVYQCGARAGAGVTQQGIMLSANGIFAGDEHLRASLSNGAATDPIFIPGIFE